MDMMYDVVRVMKESSVAGKNIPMPTVDFSRTRNCDWYDWSSLFGRYFCIIPSITKYHHFIVSKENPGKIVCKEFADSPEVQIALLKHPTTACPITNDLPEIVTSKGLDLQRQWYLCEQIYPFRHSNLAKDI